MAASDNKHLAKLMRWLQLPQSTIHPQTDDYPLIATVTLALIVLCQTAFIATASVR